MKTGITTVAAAAAVTSVTGLSLPRATQGHGYISLPIKEVRTDLSTLTKREAVEVVLKNREFYYSTDIEIGTPGQKVTVLLDTGSSELWVNPDCTTAPSASQARICTAGGSYNPRTSRTPPTGPSGTRKLNYGDPSDPTTHTSAEIAYYSDMITLGPGAEINQTFGVVTKSDGISTGIMGLAPDLRTGFVRNQPYSLLINSLAEQGVIGSRVFSLDLRHSSADSGALIYGGIDKGKFIGELQSVPIVPGARGEPRLAADMVSIGMELSNSSAKLYNINTVDQNVMLDSGTTLTRLHPSLAGPILADLNAVSDGDGYWIADCSLRTPPLTNGGKDSYITFKFGKKTIKVPFSDFILDLGPQDGQCYVGLVTTTDQQILGDSVLRAGYFVFDWDNEVIHMAQAATCGKEEIIAVGKGPGSVPSGIVGLCDGPAAKDGDEPEPSTSAVSLPAPSILGPVVPTTTNPAAETASTASLTSSPQESTATLKAPAPSSTSKSSSASPTTANTPSKPSESQSAASSVRYPSLGLLLGTITTALAVAFWNP
ncbi:Candidapepsin-2 [Colletotrichum chlorophyti]|uniref:Candidapepsin-2 n=1 Tax=Colletotrichum chlorophyti TaxID=708187 RepID=A0A1Q8S533_9PEZI|nr:Candidapepsin-2 [Colletotrichum chlorophyti]